MESQMKLVLEASSPKSYDIFRETAITILHMAKLDEVLIIHPNKKNWTKVYYEI